MRMYNHHTTIAAGPLAKACDAQLVKNDCSRLLHPSTNNTVGRGPQCQGQAITMPEPCQALKTLVNTRHQPRQKLQMLLGFYFELPVRRNHSSSHNNKTVGVQHSPAQHSIRHSPAQPGRIARPPGSCCSAVTRMLLLLLASFH